MTQTGCTFCNVYAVIDKQLSFSDPEGVASDFATALVDVLPPRGHAFHAVMLRSIEGYAVTHGDGVDRALMERAVRDTPIVPLRAGIDGPVIGQAKLDVDDVGVHVVGEISTENVEGM